MGMGNAVKSAGSPNEAQIFGGDHALSAPVLCAMILASLGFWAGILLILLGVAGTIDFSVKIAGQEIVLRHATPGVLLTIVSLVLTAITMKLQPTKKQEQEASELDVGFSGGCWDGGPSADFHVRKRNEKEVKQSSPSPSPAGES